MLTQKNLQWHWTLDCSLYLSSCPSCTPWSSFQLNNLFFYFTSCVFLEVICNSLLKRTTGLVYLITTLIIALILVSFLVEIFSKFPIRLTSPAFIFIQVESSFIYLKIKIIMNFNPFMLFISVVEVSINQAQEPSLFITQE